MTKLAPFITSFLREYMPRQRGYSPQTCETYAYCFKLLFDYVAKRLGTRPSLLMIEDLDAPMIVAFLGHIEHDRGNSASTRNVRLAAIKTFMRYVEHKVPSALEQIGRVHAIPAKRHDQKLIRHLTMEEMRAILNTPDLATRFGVRDRAMMHLCFGAGLRVSELVGVLTENLSLRHGATVMVQGKGRKERCLPLWKDTARDLRAWLSIRGLVRVPELFVNAQGDAMTRAGFEYILDKHVRKAAETCTSLRDQNVSPHQLRHSCAVIMLQATHDIRKVALWLGHTDIRTTEVYLRMDPTEKLEAVEAVVPPELRRGRFKAPDALIASLLSDLETPA
ncbi:tyrosine-type recombinase/integrase (plasmid) [Agrobacterium sp. rho-8.1]|nr:tyrosine-type recombinase/integrase [Agrobacterium sp. rho-8.1]